MQQYENAHLVYGLVLLSFLLVGFVSRMRLHNIPILMYVLVWSAVFMIVAIGYTVKDDVMQNLFPSHVTVDDGYLIVKRAQDARFYLDAVLNGKNIRFLVDTGASSTTLKPEDAKKIGINFSELTFNRKFYTANGVIDGASAEVQSFKIGDVVFENVAVSVTTGEMGISLLGMNVLEKFDYYKFDGDVLYLKP